MNDGDLDFDKLTELLSKGDEEEQQKKKKKTDLIGSTATILSIVAWVIVLAVWLVLEAAAPERERRFITSFFDVQFGTAPSIRARWDYTLVYVAYVLMLASMGICAIAFVLDRFRVRHKTGKYKKSIWVIGGITVVAFVIFLIRFGYVLF
jgi:hypothetical protein